MTTRADIVAEARTWLQTPWVHQHCMKGVAVDCAQMVMAVARACGQAPEDLRLADYGRNPDGTIQRMCLAHMDPIGQDELKPGDVVSVAMDHQPQHVGIVGDYVSGGLSFIHASNSGRKQVIESRLVFMRRFRFMAAYRFRGLSDV